MPPNFNGLFSGLIILGVIIGGSIMLLSKCFFSNDTIKTKHKLKPRIEVKDIEVYLGNGDWYKTKDTTYYYDIK